MKRDPAFVPLSHDHLSALVLVYCLKHGKGSSDRYQWPTDPAEQVERIQQIWRHELQPHFVAEEQFIFLPTQVQVSLSTQALAQELLTEHQQIEQMILQLSSLHDDALATAFIELAEKLETHIRKEERRYFEALQTELSADQLEQIGQSISDFYAELPPIQCALTGVIRQLGV